MLKWTKGPGNMTAEERPWAIFAVVMTIIVVTFAIIVNSYDKACNTPEGVDGIGWLVCPVNAFFGDN